MYQHSLFFIIGLNDHRPIDASSQSVSHPHEPRVVSIDSVDRQKDVLRWRSTVDRHCDLHCVISSHLNMLSSIEASEVMMFTFVTPSFNQNMLIWGSQLFSLFLSQKRKKNSKKFLDDQKKDFFIHT